jgi:hypothetical protein
MGPGSDGIPVDENHLHDRPWAMGAATDAAVKPSRQIRKQRRCPAEDVNRMGLTSGPGMWRAEAG